METIGPYRLLRLIGAGGMGQVFAAVHERMNQDVAVKLLPTDDADDPKSAARLIQEARLLAQIKHPGVIRVFHCERLEDGRVFLAMELLDGVSLRAWRRDLREPPTLGHALSIAAQIADAMVEVHAKGIVHRDLKPENVMLCRDSTAPSGERVTVLDFGIAKAPRSASAPRGDTQVETTAVGVPLGTYTYMAPEQCRDPATVTAAADVYALGCVLFELLAGRTPFVAERMDLLAMHMREAPPPLQQFAPAVPGTLAAFVASMLAKDPGARPSMQRVRDVLSHPLQSERDACPIPGLSSFTEQHEALFFGRDAEIGDILALLEGARTEGPRWVQIEGPSGGGKTSLVQAGLLPRLKQQRVDGAPRWRILPLRPSYDPIRQLAKTLVDAEGGASIERTTEDVDHTLRGDPGALAALITERTPSGCSSLLVIEPMEELFTLGAPGAEPLGALLSAALAVPSCPLIVLTTLRSDFAHRMGRAPLLARLAGEASRYPLRSMDEAALTQVVVGMARRAGLSLADGLPERMVRDAASEGSRLSLLSHALFGLWTRFSGALLTHEHYEQMGGVSGALARQAEHLLDDLGEEGRVRARWILLDLVQVGRGAPDTRRPRSRREVLDAAGGDPLAEEVLLRLSGARVGAASDAAESLRLVILSEGLDPEHQRVELVHETLLRQVPRIVGWIDEARPWLERYADLEAAALVWEQAGCPAKGLPTDSLLEHYRSVTGSSPRATGLSRAASPRARRFLEAARRLDRRRRWSTRAFIGALCVTTLVTAFAERRTAEEQRRTAEEQRRTEATLQHFMRLVDKVVSDADWTLGRLLYTLEARRAMLDELDREVSALPASTREAPEIRQRIIKTKHRRGDLALRNGTLAEAEGFFAEARREIDRGLVLRPSDEEFRDLSAMNDSKQGKVALARGEITAADAHFRPALSAFEDAVRRNGDPQADDLRTLATSDSEQAELELARNQVEAASMFDERAIRLLEMAAMRDRPEDRPYDEALLALTRCERAEAIRRGGDLKSARGEINRALALQEPLARAAPGNAYYRWILAAIYLENAALATAEGALDIAAQHHRVAQEIGRDLHQAEPSNKDYALVLARSLLGEESVARARGDLDRAAKVRRERCPLVSDAQRSDPDDVRWNDLACR